jgi:hypothetical protein
MHKRSLVSVGGAAWKDTPRMQAEVAWHTRLLVAVGSVTWKLNPRSHLVMNAQLPGSTEKFWNCPSLQTSWHTRLLVAVGATVSTKSPVQTVSAGQTRSLVSVGRALS